MPLHVRDRLPEPVHYPDNPVRFSFAKCDTKRYCISNLQRNEITALYAKLGRLENMTWATAVGVQRESGISIDKRGSQAYALLSARAPEIGTFGHIRVDGTDANTRVFIGRDRDLARVLLIDRKGELQH